MTEEAVLTADSIASAQQQKQIAQLYLYHTSIPDIAQQMRMTPLEVMRELSLLLQEWRASASAAIEDIVARELAELDDMEKLTIRELLKSLRGYTDPDTGEKVIIIGKVVDWMNCRLKVKERRAKMLGLDAGTRSQGKVNDAVSLNLQQRDAVCRRLRDLLLAQADPGEAAGDVRPALAAGAGDS